jgi:Bifunctional DNA primase/polymerase, N-terminal/Primase C terminal 2 (PriCT-2)/Family of unknown function (DUF5906)
MNDFSEQEPHGQQLQSRQADDAVTDTAPSCLSEALRYATEFNWISFPVPLGTKKSHKSEKVSGGGKKWGATKDPDQIKRDFKKWPTANVGIPTGAKNGFFVVEADTLAGGHKVDGIASLQTLIGANGPLPETRTARSRSGSMHYYFKYPDGVKIINSTSEVAPGVDVRGEGGMVVAPPSVKPGRGTYEWLSEADIADAPPWLLELVIKKERERKPAGPVKADIAEVQKAVRAIRNDDLNWEHWNTTGMAIFAATNGNDEGYKAFDDFSQKSDKYDVEKVDERWANYTAHPPTEVGTAELFGLADRDDPTWRAAVKISDFIAYSPLHDYIYIPTRAHWPAASVNGRLPSVALTKADGSPVFEPVKKNGVEKQKYISASSWLDQNSAVEQMTWAPGLPLLIRDRLCADGGWFDHMNARCLNLYRPPTIVHGDATDVAPWLDHIHKVYPNEAEEFINYCCHLVQNPQIKINHAIFMGGDQGIGKDTMLEPVKRAVGPWNFQETTPRKMQGQFNGYLKAVVLRISEAHDLGETNRFAFYELMKGVCAAPPDVHRINEKHIGEYYIQNCNGTFITTNHKTDGIYLPPEDRRTFVMWSNLTKEDFDEAYWDHLWRWYEAGGDANVAAYLATKDISSFNPKKPPRKTEAFHAIVSSNMAPEESELADLIDAMGNPAAVTIAQLVDYKGGFATAVEWLDDRRNRRAIPHKMEAIGYLPVRNTSAKDGLWVINKRRQVVYAKRDLTIADQNRVVGELIKDLEPTQQKT